MKRDMVEILIGILVIVVVPGAFLNVLADMLNVVVGWIVSALISALLSTATGHLVEVFTGDLLKKLSITVEIKGIKFSLTAFFVAVVLVRYLLFWALISRWDMEGHRTVLSL